MEVRSLFTEEGGFCCTLFQIICCIIVYIKVLFLVSMAYYFSVEQYERLNPDVTKESCQSNDESCMDVHTFKYRQVYKLCAQTPGTMVF
jgi:hypothetical protein